MRLKPFLALAIVTAAVVGGTMFALDQRESATRGTTERQILYPELTAHINDVSRLTVHTSADGTITMQRDGDRWGMVEKSDYAVDFEKVRKALIEMAALNAIEPRTSKPDLYGKLQVEDVDQDLSNSIRITATAGDETLADLLVGKTRPVDEGGGVFVRKVGEEQSWLAEGSFQPQRKPVQWLARNIVNVDQRRIRRAEFARPDGEGVVIAKPDPVAEGYTLETPVPEGRTVKADSELTALAGITDFLILEDVLPAAEVDFSTSPVVDRFVTYDGLELVMTVVEQDANTWMRVEAAPAERTDGLETLVEEQKGKDSREGRIADQMKTPEEVEQEIAAINGLVKDWAYRVTTYKSGKLKTTIEDVTEKAEPEKPSAGQTGAGEAASPAPTGTGAATAK